MSLHLLRTVVAAVVVGLLAGIVAGPAPGPASAEPPAIELDRQIRSASTELSSVVERYNELREDLRVTVAQAKVLAAQVAPLEARVDQIRERIGVIAVTAYKTAGVDEVNLLLTASAGTDFVRRLDLLDHLARERQAEIDSLHLARDQFVAARRTLEALTGQQRQQERELADRKARIEQDIARLRALRMRAYGADERGLRTGLSLPPVPTGLLGAVVRFATAQLGKGYRFAGDGPDAYDCSGLVLAAYRAIGVVLPHSSRQQWHRVQPINRTELRPGDLIFYYSDIHHVGIYVGESKMIHAPTYGEPVRVDPIDHAPIHGYGRLPAPAHSA